MAKIGIIGRGWGERVQSTAFREAGLEVAMTAGRDNWRDAIAADVDLVTIVTPPSEHLAMATAALDAGKHVVSEKPTAMNAAEAEQLVVAARRHPDRFAIIDHELRFLPAWRAARERIGDLGAVRYAEVRYASPSRGDRTRPWNWWSAAERGGGIWGAVGSHFVDALRYFGMEIEAVQALLHTTITERSGRSVTSDDFASVNLRLRGGGVATMTFSAVSSAPDEPSTLTIHCEDGAIRLVNEEALLAPRGGAFEDGLAQQRVLDAARRSSANEGRWESV